MTSSVTSRPKLTDVSALTLLSSEVTSSFTSAGAQINDAAKL